MVVGIILHKLTLEPRIGFAPIFILLWIISIMLITSIYTVTANIILANLIRRKLVG